MNEISPAENQYMGLFRDLDKFSTQAYGMEIIDHDFGPDHKPYPDPPHSLDGFRRKFTRLHDEINDDERAAGFMRRNIESTFDVMAAAPHTLSGNVTDYGDGLDFPSYVERVMGVRPEFIPDNEIERQKAELAEVVGRLGYELTATDRDEFNEQYAVPSEKVEETILRLAGVSMDDLAAAAGEEALEGLERPDIRPVYAGAAWQGYFYTSNKNFFIDVNTNPFIKSSELATRLVPTHENGHWMSSATSKLLIARGELSPVKGFLLSHSPEYTREEIIARTVEGYMMGNQEGDLADYVRMSTKLELDVGTNMTLGANTGWGWEKAVRCGRKHLAFQEPKRTKKIATEVTESLVHKTVYSIDSFAIDTGYKIAQMPDQQRKDILARLCSEIISPEEIKDLADTASAQVV